MSLDPETSGALAAWAATTPARGTAPVADPPRPAGYRGRRRGRHHRDRQDNTGKWIVADPVDAGYGLSPAAQQLVTQTTQQIHAGPDQDTGLLIVRPVTPDPDRTDWINPAAVRAATSGQDRTAAMAEMRADLDQTRADLSDPIGDADRIWRRVAGAEPPAITADDTQQIGPVQ
jgi:hypothetical protein